jgi:hypothetical protein
MIKKKETGVKEEGDRDLIRRSRMGAKEKG